jgi:5-methylcytosine-specific restriction endonuclease McrA
MVINISQQVSDTGFYQTKEWRACRNGYYNHMHGLCERCGSPGNIAHHTIYLTLANYTDPNISLNWDYLGLLCGDCDNKEA